MSPLYKCDSNKTHNDLIEINSFFLSSAVIILFFPILILFFFLSFLLCLKKLLTNCWRTHTQIHKKKKKKHRKKCDWTKNQEVLEWLYNHPTSFFLIFFFFPPFKKENGWCLCPIRISSSSCYHAILYWDDWKTIETVTQVLKTYHVNLCVLSHYCVCLCTVAWSKM